MGHAKEIEGVRGINLKHLKSCNQDWKSMKEGVSGRVCSKCEKEIIDFRNMSLPELATVHALSDSPVCGVYSKEQLSNHDAESRKSLRPNFIKPLLIASLGVSQFDLHAQVNKPVDSVLIDRDQVSNEKEWQEKRPTERRELQQDSIYLDGTVKDEMGGGIYLAVVFVKEINLGVNTDQSGHYAMDLTDAFAQQDSLTIRVTCIGYQALEFQLRKEDVNGRITKELVLAPAQVVAFGVPVKVPLHKRVWYGIKGLFTKKS